MSETPAPSLSPRDAFVHFLDGNPDDLPRIRFLDARGNPWAPRPVPNGATVEFRLHKAPGSDPFELSGVTFWDDDEGPDQTAVTFMGGADESLPPIHQVTIEKIYTNDPAQIRFSVVNAITEDKDELLEMQVMIRSSSGRLLNSRDPQIVMEKPPG